ncbi:MAG: O-antigen ligase family protein [Pseudomonadota bacterium]
MVATFLALRLVIARSSIVAAGQMQTAFLIQIAYAIFTWLIAALVIKYQGYDLVDSGIKLKGSLIDYYIFFLVFLFGVQSVEDGTKVIKWMLLGVIFANAATVLDASGLIDLGYKERIDGRTQGALGESNQYAAYIILFIPAMVAAAVGARGLVRLFWVGGVFSCAAALMMTASRGGFVGLLVAIAAGAYLYRHLVSYNRIAGWVLGSLALFVIAMSLSKYGGLLTERVFGQSGNIDANEATSGRTEIWANLFETMFHAPITFITGFGWDVYWSFPFRFSPHNHYFSLWFNLGLVGLFTGAYLLFSAIGRARRASLEAEPAIRRQLIAFVLGGTAVCVAVCFVELHEPWISFWMYTGVVMRLISCAQERPVPLPVPDRRSIRPALPRDAYGWVGAQGRR